MNLRRRSNRRRNLFLALSAGVILVMLIDVISGGILRSVTVRTMSVFLPLGLSGQEMQSSASAEYISTLESKLALLETLEAENISMRTELDALLRLGTTSPGVDARVLLPPRGDSATMLIDAGFNNGVRIGQKVIVGNKTLVGFIKEAGPKSALVSLISQSGSSTRAFFGTSTVAISSNVIGRGNGNFYALVPRGNNFATGTPVIMQGGFVVAVVEGRGGVETDPQVTYYLRVPYNLEGARVVRILFPQEKK